MSYDIDATLAKLKTTLIVRGARDKFVEFYREETWRPPVPMRPGIPDQ